MTTATASTTSPAGPLVLADPAGTVRLARWTGAAYLALGVTGVVGILALAPQLTAADPAATLAALRANDALARAVIAMELGVVISQALAAVWFWRLFSALGRTADGVAALPVGLVNALADPDGPRRPDQWPDAGGTGLAARRRRGRLRAQRLRRPRGGRGTCLARGRPDPAGDGRRVLDDRLPARCRRPADRRSLSAAAGVRRSPGSGPGATSSAHSRAWSCSTPR